MAILSNYNKSKLYLNKYVKIVTATTTYQGQIVKVTPTKVFLKVSSAYDGTKVHTSFLPFVLPLVLFDLLAIVLLDTNPRRRF